MTDEIPALEREDWGGITGIHDIRRLKKGMLFTKGGHDVWEVESICEDPCCVVVDRKDDTWHRHLREQDFCLVKGDMVDIKRIFLKPSLTLSSLRSEARITGEEGSDVFEKFVPLVPDKEWCANPIEE